MKPIKMYFFKCQLRPAVVVAVALYHTLLPLCKYF